VSGEMSHLNSVWWHESFKQRLVSWVI